MSTYKIIMNQKNSSGDYDVLLPKSSGSSFINVTADAGTKITVTGPNSYNQTYNLSQSENEHGFPVTDDGSYTLKVIFTDGTQSSKTISKSGEGIFTCFFSEYDAVLNNNTWAKISKASAAGLASSLWSIGDVKMDTINGTINNCTVNGSYGFYIADFDHNKEKEGSGILFMGFKTGYINGTDVALCETSYSKGQTAGFIMNPSTSEHQDGYNKGGWASSYMRNTIIPAFKQMLSSSLKGVIKTTTIYTDNVGNNGGNVDANISATTDTIYLAAEYEVFGARKYANSYEQNYQTQFAYYKNGNSKIKYNHSSTSSDVFWWGRSPKYNGAGNFCIVTYSGGADYANAYRSYGFAPVFKV